MDISNSTSIAVLGAGSWGTALALLLAGNGVHTRLWGHEPEHMQALLRDKQNHTFLPGFGFPDTLLPCVTLQEAVAHCDDILVVVPSYGFRDLLGSLKPLLGSGSRIAWATKGFEAGSGKLMHEVIQEVLGDRPMAVLSGPTFALEVAHGLPTAMTIAANQPDFGAHLADLLHNKTFRAYTGSDLAGVEIGGAVKNVLAIAAGAADGLNFGANTRAALITRGLHEMSRLGKVWNCDPQTFMGLAGIGDLALTCTDDQSRNRRMGIALARGQSAEDAQKEIGQAIEGVGAAREIHRLSVKHGIDMPICEQTYQVLFEGLDPRTAVGNLLHRQKKAEISH